MSDLGERLIAAMESAIAEDNPQTHDISELRRIRNKLNMGVPEFSKTFGLPKRTVEKWDVKDGDLTGAASVLLKVIDKRPEAVIEALSDG